MEVLVVNNRSAELVADLLELWNRSVRVTHNFLAEDDIQRLRPCVAEALRAVPILAIASAENETTGFVGIAEDKVEMLFVSPNHIGRGVGRMLLDWAVRTHGCRYIDVNEQNEDAVAVYRHWGFRVYERTETDDQGNPFPILRMMLTV